MTKMWSMGNILLALKAVALQLQISHEVFNRELVKRTKRELWKVSSDKRYEVVSVMAIIQSRKLANVKRNCA